MESYKLTQKERDALIADLKSGYDPTSLAEYYGLTKQAVYYYNNTYVKPELEARKKKNAARRAKAKKNGEK